MVSGSSSFNNSKLAGSLEKTLATLLLQSVSTIHNKKPIVHPVVCINAVKNILGDVRNSPSDVLLSFASNFITGLSSRRKDRKGLEDMPHEEIPAILEILAELALQNVEGNGGFIYHCLRAFAFKPEKERVWSFVQCILKTIKKQPLYPPNVGTNNGPKDMELIFQNCEKPIDWITVSAVWRLWESEYGRLPGFKREISHWISNQNTTKNKNPDGSNPDNIMRFKKNGGSYFVKVAENIIKSNYQVLERLSALEALRYFVKKMPIDCLPIVAKKINFLMNNNESR